MEGGRDVQVSRGEDGEVGTQGNRDAPTENIHEARTDKSRECTGGTDVGMRDSTRKANGGWGEQQRRKLKQPQLSCYK